MKRIRVSGPVLCCLSLAAAMTGAACGRVTPPAVEKEAATQTAAAAAPAHAPERLAATVIPAPVPASTGLRRQPACDLITRDEMAGMLGAPVAPPTSEDSGTTTRCVYPPGETGSRAQAEVAIDWQHSGDPTFEKQLADAFGGSAPGRQVARRIDLGDEAAYSREGVLSVRLGTALITVTLPMRPQSEEQVIAIGRKLVERLGGAVRPPAQSASTTPDAPTPDEEASIFDELLSLFKDATQEEGTPVFPEGLSLRDDCPDEPAAPVVGSEPSRIPLEAGLTLSHMWTPRAGGPEYECLVQVVAVTSSYIDTTQSCSYRPDRAPHKRRLCRADLHDGSFFLTHASETLPRVVAGATMFSLSTRAFRELNTAGRTRHRYIEILDEWKNRVQPLEEETDVTLSMRSGGPQPYTIIVNDQAIEVPTLVASAVLDSEEVVIATMLDDERFPLVLDYQAPPSGFRLKRTKISFPTDDEIEKQLASEKRVDVYGIYFDFASDRLRAESGPVLAEIAGVLAKNADWKLMINGHTDNIGGDAFNLDLSRRRSASVRRALSERFAIDAARLTTAGFGASQPKEDNSTSEGRAKNRRVELVRQ